MSSDEVGEVGRAKRAAEVRLVADTAVRAGRLNDAIAMYQDALQLEPEDPLTRNNLGRAIALIQWSAPAIDAVDLRLPLAQLAPEALRPWLGRLPAEALSALDLHGTTDAAVPSQRLLDWYRDAMKLRPGPETDCARLDLFARAAKVAVAAGSPRDFLVRAASAFLEAAKVAYWHGHFGRSRHLTLAFFRSLGLLLEAGSEIPPAHRAASGHAIGFLAGSHFAATDVRTAVSQGLLDPRRRVAVADTLATAVASCPEVVVRDIQLSRLPRDLRALLVAKATSPAIVTLTPFGDTRIVTELVGDHPALRNLLDIYAHENLMSTVSTHSQDWKAAHLRAAARVADEPLMNDFAGAQRVVRVEPDRATRGTVARGALVSHPIGVKLAERLEAATDPVLRIRALVDLLFVFTVAVASVLPPNLLGLPPTKALSFGDWLTFLERGMRQGAESAPDRSQLLAAVRVAVRLRNELAHSTSLPKRAAAEMLNHEASLLEATRAWEHLLPGVMWEIDAQIWLTVTTATKRANPALLVVTTTPSVRCWFLDRRDVQSATYQATDLPRSEGSRKLALTQIPAI